MVSSVSSLAQDDFQRGTEDDSEEEGELLGPSSSEEDAVASLVYSGAWREFSIEPDESQVCERVQGGKSSREDVQVRGIHWAKAFACAIG